MAILQVHQAKALKQVYEGSIDQGLMQEFAGPWDDSVKRSASSLSPMTHLASSQENVVRGCSASNR